MADLGVVLSMLESTRQDLLGQLAAVDQAIAALKGTRGHAVDIPDAGTASPGSGPLVSREPRARSRTRPPFPFASNRSVCLPSPTRTR